MIQVVGRIMANLNTIVVISLIVAYSASFSNTFLLSDDQCLAPPPCTCSGSAINCASKNLISLPEFIATTGNHYYAIDLDLSSNGLTSIPANAFSNVSSANATVINLKLFSNKINYIATNAFTGIENATHSVELQNNNLSSVPAALGELPFLQALNLEDNPIQVLDSFTMSSIGHSLTKFSISLAQCSSWPTELHFLRKLSTLTLDEIPYPRLDINAFHGLETTLTSLTIRSSKLERIPYAVCHLVNLRYLDFSSNHNSQSPIFEPCHMTSVTSLTLNRNNINEFPYLFNEFPSLTMLSLQINEIRLIDIALIPDHYNLKTLLLNMNQFNRIPFAVNKLTSLQTLQFLGNKILTVEDNDLVSLNALTSLDLAYNPLEYISPNAFMNNTLISYIRLESTQLMYIPRAVVALPNLKTLILKDGKPIECTCTMAYLKPWNVTSVNIDGTCESSTESLKDFVLKSIPQCP